jgi:hypothetical protein
MITKNKPSSFVTLWYKPASSMRVLLDAGQGHSAAVMVAAFFGAVQSIPFSMRQESSGPLFYLVGAAAGGCGLYLFGWLTRNFSRWFRAEAIQRDVRTALGLSLLPWTLLFLPLPFLRAAEMDAATIKLFYFVFFIGFVYGYVILLLSLSSALKISVLKTFLCLIVTILVSLFPLTLLAQLFVNVFGSAA